ncbi:hypothetical protein [Actinomyces weissii]|uniref:Uncharacterized protein n=1 Tax=Actinomyces weissii TaxID=675090 RepID=A0A7T7S2Y4_9ACTO|nr:hypothetical protein [Actinomyces weissii]QQM68175.1 hypothetical protein JG540_04960 [Actinomyces weissii]
MRQDQAGTGDGGPAARPEVLTPLSVERIAGLLKQRGDVFFIDSARRLGGGDWNRVFFYFLLQGDDREALEVRADYPGTVSAVHLEKVREVIDDSNRRFPLVQGLLPDK